MTSSGVRGTPGPSARDPMDVRLRSLDVVPERFFELRLSRIDEVAEALQRRTWVSRIERGGYSDHFITEKRIRTGLPSYYLPMSESLIFMIGNLRLISCVLRVGRINPPSITEPLSSDLSAVTLGD